MLAVFTGSTVLNSELTLAFLNVQRRSNVLPGWLVGNRDLRSTRNSSPDKSWDKEPNVLELVIQSLGSLYY